MLTKEKNRLPKCNIMITVGIVWIMINIISFHSYAKDTFNKLRPVGVMSTAVGNNIAVSWEPVKGATGYRIYEAVEENASNKKKVSYRMIKQTKSCQSIRTGKEPGRVYHYYIRAYRMRKETKIYSKSSKKVSTTVATEGISTVKNFLQTAISPIGSTMYVWGGGWNKEDTAAGKDAKQIGLRPAWRRFSSNQRASYNYKNYRYQIHNGLDCSGYVGWCVYNVLHTKKNQKGYVYSASKQAKQFAKQGFGRYRTAKEIKNYHAGDIMSSTCKCCGHVWIVVGQCRDKSVVLVHASPSGVQLCGTTTPSGKKNSKAYKLARKYMKKYYRAWYKRYPNVSRGKAYLSHYGQMSWNTSGEKVVLSDPDGYQNMSAEEVLKDLFK